MGRSRSTHGGRAQGALPKIQLFADVDMAEEVEVCRPVLIHSRFPCADMPQEFELDQHVPNVLIHFSTRLIAN